MLLIVVTCTQCLEKITSESAVSGFNPAWRRAAAFPNNGGVKDLSRVLNIPFDAGLPDSQCTSSGQGDRVSPSVFTLRSLGPKSSGEVIVVLAFSPAAGDDIGAERWVRALTISLPVTDLA